MKVRLSRQDSHTSEIMGADTVALCKMQGFNPRLENERQSREEANAFGYKAEFAVARLFNAEPPVINVLSDGGVDLWLDGIPVDVKFTTKSKGLSSLTRCRSSVLKSPFWLAVQMTRT